MEENAHVGHHQINSIQNKDDKEPPKVHRQNSMRQDQVLRDNAKNGKQITSYSDKLNEEDSFIVKETKRRPSHINRNNISLD